MSAKLHPYPSEKNSTLRVFCPDKSVVTSFESYVPNYDAIGRMPGTRLHLPGKVCWLKKDYDYYAFLPKRHLFKGHLLAALKHRKLKHIQKDGSWFVDDETRELWRSLDNNITNSINIVGRGMFVDLNHHEPRRAVDFGFTRGHAADWKLRICLEFCRKAFIHRLAYLAYLISVRYQWDRDLADQEWRRDLTSGCGPIWVDSLWDAIYRQWKARDFVGVVVTPPLSSSIRWLKSARTFGVPIWVVVPSPTCYSCDVDGSFVMKEWIPTKEQVLLAEKAKFEIQLDTQPATSTASSLPPNSPIGLSPAKPTHVFPIAPPLGPQDPSKSISPPTDIPENTQWYESWEEYFLTRKEKDKLRFETTSEAEKMVWKDRALVAEKFSLPVKGGATVYVWESCESGGFFRIRQTRHEVLRDWESYYTDALIFNQQQNIWDYCPFSWEPAVENGPPDDLDENGNLHIMEHWYTEPDKTTNLPEDNPEPSDFLFRRYGFLTTEPTSPPTPILPFQRSAAYRIVGLEAQSSDKSLQHINSFLTDILQGRLPAGHCDLSTTSETNHMSRTSCRTSIYKSMFFSQFPELSDSPVFTFVYPDDPRVLVVHEPLSVLEMVRAETPSNLKAQLQYLLDKGSRFTVLYPKTWPSTSPNFNILTFPVREEGWTPKAEDFKAYMSRLVTFLLERPYVAAAASFRGGIAWRIALEVLGTEESINLLSADESDLRSSVRTRRGTYLFHEPSEAEWFYLVGGYETLTGKGNQTRDMSWWPKITTWEASGIYVGCWTPMCENWFRKRFKSLREGKTKPYSSSQWSKNLRYEGSSTKKFFSNWKNIGRRYLIEECKIKEL